MSGIKYRKLRYRDGEIIESSEEWLRLLESDIDVENSKSNKGVADEIRLALGNKNKVTVNGHEYKYIPAYEASNVREIFSALTKSGSYEELFDALSKVDRGILETLIEYIPSIGVDKNTGKYIYYK